MANPENILPYRFKKGRDSELAREAGRKGGKARGEQRRRQKAMREYADMLLSSSVSDANAEALRAKYDGLVDLEVVDYATAIVAKQLEKAFEGDLKAAEWLADMQEQSKGTRTAEPDALSKSLMEEAEAMEAERLSAECGDTDAEQ